MKWSDYRVWFFITGFFLMSCGQRHSIIPEATRQSLASVPGWSKEAIWYQIFVERFRNGDPSNDPTPVDMAGGFPDFLPVAWHITPWGHDWYSHEPWIDSVQAG